MLRRLLLLLILLPFVELAILVWIGSKTSLLFVVGLVLLTGIVGTALARYEGLRVWRQVESRIQRGETPADSLMEELMVLVAGLLLAIPGVLTDIVGLLLLIPPVRRLVWRQVQERIRQRLQRGAPPHPGPRPSEMEHGRDRIIDVKILDVESRDPGEGDQKT